MQTKEELEKFYKKNDPWGYVTNPQDEMRKRIILSALKKLNYPFIKALDIGCGEGFLTKDLPAKKIYGYDISEIAMSRLPSNVIPLTRNELTGKYDLVIATGILYKQYDHEWIVKKIKECASRYILLCNILNWEINPFINPVFNDYFPYRRFIEHIAIYEVANS